MPSPLQSNNKPDRPLKILLVGDYSNYSVTLAGGLRQLGHEVTLASEGSHWLNTSRDIDISRHPGKAGGLALWLKLMTTLAPRLRGHDIVAINNPVVVNLRPGRARRIFDRLARGNGAVFLMCTGTDTFHVREATDRTSPIRYNEWRIGDSDTPLAIHDRSHLDWLKPPLSSLCEHVYATVDGATSALYEYHVASSRRLGRDGISYAGIPVDTSALRPINIDDTPQRVNIFLGRHRERMQSKGTDLLEAAARRVAGRHPDKAELIIVENKPYDEYLHLLNHAHIVLDQVYSYTPATNALLAMAKGQTVVSGGESDYYDFIGEHDNRPIINALPDVDYLERVIEEAVMNPGLLRERGLRGREFVMKHNDVSVVTERTLSFWMSKLAGKP